jgi:hypothetical protein
MENAEAREQK